MARRRLGRSAALVAQHDPHARTLCRALRKIGGRDRSGSRLAPGRKPAAGLLARTRHGATAPHHDGQELRTADGDHRSTTCAGAVPADVDRWRVGRRVPADRWVHRPGECHPGDRQGSADAQGAHLRAHQGHLDHRRWSTGHRCSHCQYGCRYGCRYGCQYRWQYERHQLRDGCQRGRHVGHGDRPDGGRSHPGRRCRAPVRADRTDRRVHTGRAASDADDARSRSARLLQTRRPRAADRRLRTRHAAVRSRGHSDAVSTAVAGTELRAVRTTGDTCGPPNAGDRTGRHTHDDQRPDPLLGRRRLRDGQGSRARQLLRRHRVSCTASPPAAGPAR